MRGIVVKSLLFALFVYFFFPQPEDKILVILKSNGQTSGPVEEMENISQAFKIIFNGDSHLEHVDTNRRDFNYAVVSRGLTNPEEKKAFVENVEQKDFIVKKEVFHYKTSPVRTFLLNLIIKIKGIFANDQFTPNADKKMPELCNEESCKDPTPRVTINVIKVNQKKKEDLDLYFKGAVLGLFPKTGSHIVEMGEAVSEYWNQVALMQHSSTSSMCELVESQEYSQVAGYKTSGTDDTHTYVAQLI